MLCLLLSNLWHLYVYAIPSTQLKPDTCCRVPDAELLAAMHKKKKKKKLRIYPDKVSGSKIVFGEDGGALDPMEALAQGIQVSHVPISFLPLIVWPCLNYNSAAASFVWTKLSVMCCQTWNCLHVVWLRRWLVPICLRWCATMSSTHVMYWPILWLNTWNLDAANVLGKPCAWSSWGLKLLNPPKLICMRMAVRYLGPRAVYLLPTKYSNRQMYST